MKHQLERHFRTLIRSGGSDPRDFPLGCDEYKAGIILLAADVLHTTNTQVLAQFIGGDTVFVEQCRTHLQANGVWCGKGSQNITWWKAYGGVAFIMDILVALGRVRRVYEDTTIYYATLLTLSA